MRNKNNEMNNYSKSILNGGMTEENEQIPTEENNNETQIEDTNSQEFSIVEDKIDLAKIMEKFNPDEINKFISSPQGVSGNTGSIPTIDELTGKIFDGFLTSRLKNVSKWEDKCNFKSQTEESSNLEQKYNQFLDEVSKLDEESSKESKTSSAKPSKKPGFFSRLAKKIGLKKGGGDEVTDDNPDEQQVEQSGFMKNIEEIENHFIDKWKKNDLYEIFDLLKPKPVLEAVKNPQKILTSNKPNNTPEQSQDPCSDEWNLILDNICQTRNRSYIIYLESLKTIDPDFESDYDPELLSQKNFEYDSENNPNGFKLDNGIHYFHEEVPKKKKKISRMGRSLAKLKYTLKNTGEKASEGISNAKKTMKKKISDTGKAISSVSLPSVSMPGLSFSSEHDKKLDKHLEFQVANSLISGINKQKERMKKETERGRLLAQQ